eukprot:718099-Amphidinium_carterae.3
MHLIASAAGLSCKLAMHLSRAARRSATAGGSDSWTGLDESQKSQTCSKVRVTTETIGQKQVKIYIGILFAHFPHSDRGHAALV